MELFAYPSPGLSAFGIPHGRGPTNRPDRVTTIMALTDRHAAVYSDTVLTIAEGRMGMHRMSAR